MKFTDIFIKRPVWAVVISLLILILGLRSIFGLPVNQWPRTENTVVTITTNYYGADAATVAGFITQPMESAIAQAQGIDYLSSSSITGVSTITATLRLNYDSSKALTEINTQINSVKNQLPAQAQQPVLSVAVGQTTDAMYLGFYSDVLATNNITDYLARVVKPKLDAIEGVQTAEILGGRQFALRAWLDPAKLAAHNVSAQDVYAALSNNNYLSAVGSTKGQMVKVDLTAGTDLHNVDEFKRLVIKQNGDALVHLEDVANVTLGAENYDTSVAFSGKRSVFIGIKVAPNANILTVAEKVRQAFPELKSQLPAGVRGDIVYDSTEFINTSIDEVIKTLAEALLIVTIVIYLFLGAFRAVIVPLVAIPLSLVGTFFIMFLLGYSINLLTLLALVLAIGLVVDDAIIVVENVDRHIKEEGKSVMEAALIAARELGGPILAMTVVLVAAYVPIGLRSGLTGALFKEFCFSLAGAVTVSGIVALTLSPMMTSRLFKSGQEEGRFARLLDHYFDRLRGAYHRLLTKGINIWPVLVTFGFILFALVAAAGFTARSELSPTEDQGLVFMQLRGAPNASPQQMQMLADHAYQIAKKEPEYDQMFQLTGVPALNQGLGGVLLKPWNQRDRSQADLVRDLQRKWSEVAGAQIAAFPLPSLPGAQGLPVQFVITTTEPIDNLNEVAQAVMAEAQKQQLFWFADLDLKLDKPQAKLVVDREKIAALGMTEADVGAALSAALGGNYVNYFSIAGRSYKVIPQTLQVDRLNPDQILDYYIRTPSGSMIPARTVAHIETSVQPESINHFQQLNSATISGVSGLSQGELLEKMRTILTKVAPKGYSADYSGESRQFMQESGGFVGLLLFSILIVYLALAFQFESYRDPIVILFSVPPALFGALAFITTGFASINVYTQVGLVTLLGLITKHGILIVQFANELQRAGRSKREAIEEAAAVRLRPILMTTAAMVLGVVPLVWASGAGAAGRHDMGLVIFAGLGIGTMLTLFLVPAMYMFIGTTHRSEVASQADSVPSPAV
ncbi:efflux RND transporter permease subunit [Ralstonia insidiosa]|jgi:multidrug efflux pump|uniref:efflux RND transporter permease subunit n=1 Tax=Ralstonia TaxID=48736 RepID=UPI000664A41B|nr:efflux RND transporter permease subunit [Ralstonia insidiosa]KMW45281.1 acriflavine resistance protein B [Ralstonia sp. MD27]MBX3774463.1 efflux RND transporter permease subunit [Ralstonia pickettii]MBA9859047.1 multidrug efflux protein [Ralstonia insidiosa]MBA9873531.1 multidrug efflux protein [Ralstonia insidiosa]MBA9940594.1 multidrug efflux protein [Ralstonia insidiosa]